MQIVAFSYEIGSFGKPVAMDLAQTAGLDFIPFSDIYHEAISRNTAFRRHQDHISKGRGDGDIWEGHFFDLPAFTSLFESLVLEMVSAGKVVMVGPAIQAVLRHLSGVLLVHVCAPVEIRVKRFMTLNQITMAEANQTIKWWDQRLRALCDINSFFDGAGNMPACDLIINTDRVSIPSASRILSEALSRFPGPLDPEVWRKNVKRLALAKQVECAVREHCSSLGLVPLEVRPSDDEEDVLWLGGFVQSPENAKEAELLAQKAAEGYKIKSSLKILQLHNDLMPAYFRHKGGPHND